MNQQDAFEQELFDLITRYEDDALDDAGLARLNELLIGSAEARDAFNDVCLQSLSISEALAVEGVILPQEAIQSTGGNKIIQFPRWLGVAAAVFVALLATVYYLIQSDAPSLDIAEEGMEFIMGFWNPESGGFYSSYDERDADTKEDLLQKEKQYAEHRQTIELVLESFYRSANSLVFQLNKRYIPKHKSILRVIDRRYETNECFIRYDDSPDEDWLILIYLEDSDAKKGKIVVENKANPEKHETKSFETKEIFTYSDYLVDTMTAHIDRERQKRAQV